MSSMIDELVDAGLIKHGVDMKCALSDKTVVRVSAICLPRW